MMDESDQGFEGDQATATSTRFSQLLFGGGGDDDDLGQGFNYTSCFADNDDANIPKMLCFGGHQNNGEIVFGDESATLATKKRPAGVACTDSSSTSSANNTKSFKDAIVKAQPASRRTCKKFKVENPTAGHAKVRKEKLGDRITALQQLVSPFGKTDTASVLLEAMGYIRFLHDQVQVLCSPYLQNPHPPNGGEKAGKELKSRGLCLFPVSCILHVANNNGADLWSPTTAMKNNVI